MARLKGELIIDGKDAYTTFGVWLQSVAPLRGFAPMKEYTTNKSPLMPGKTVHPEPPMVDERDITLTMFIQAANEQQFESRRDAFEALMQSGTLEWRIPTHNSKVYRLNYVSCTSYDDFNGRLGKFILKMNEPAPSDRGERI